MPPTCRYCGHPYHEQPCDEYECRTDHGGHELPYSHCRSSDALTAMLAATDRLPDDIGHGLTAAGFEMGWKARGDELRRTVVASGSDSPERRDFDAEREVAYRLRSTLAEAAIAGVTLGASERRDLARLLAPASETEREGR